MRTTKWLSILTVVAILAGVLALPTLAAPATQPAQQGTNLINDPSFDKAAVGDWRWQWWNYTAEVYTDVKKEYDLNQSYFAPNYAPSEAKWNRGGEEQPGSSGKVDGQQNRKFRGGFYQVVQNITPGSRVRFSIWGNGFCVDNVGTKCNVKVRAGVDPNGGTDALSGSVVWADASAIEKWVSLTAPEVTVGASGKVTVFTWGEPEWPFLYNAAYFDDASLVVTSAPSVTPTGAAPAAPAAPTAAPQPAAQKPCAQMQFITDVTIPDDSPIAPGAQFVKTWRIKNTGTCAWAGSLNFIGTGNRMNGTSPTAFPQIPVGKEAELSINLTAPTQPGAYLGTWQVRTTDGVVLENLFLKIKVTESAPAPQPTTAAAAAVTATPQKPAAPAPAPTATPSVGQICIAAFSDLNSDGLQDVDEGLLKGITFTLADPNGAAQDAYTTDGQSEPYCFTNLTPGSYTLSARVPVGYNATSPKTQIIAVGGGKQDMLFGAKKSGAAATPTRAAGGATASSVLGSVGRVILIVAAVLILIGLGFAGGFMLMNRR